jgi:ferrochelatase
MSQYNHGILLANLGSPASPTEGDVRAFLGEFLMDKRVMDMPAPIRSLIVKRMILPKRPAQSALAYQRIWWEEGSPLVVLTERVRAKLEAALHVPVVAAMRYGQPSLRSGLKQLLTALGPAGEVVVFPMYPHYAMSTYETLVLKTMAELEQLVGVGQSSERAMQRWLRQAVSHHHSRALVRKVGAYRLRIIPPHYDHPDYIAALVASARPALERADFQHLLFSFHGIPERHLRKTAPRGSRCLRATCQVSTPVAHGVCYRHHVYATARAFAWAAGLSANDYSVSFQSRLGRDAWLQPYTVDELVRLARAGVERLAVITPSFTVDCLETLEEIGMEARKVFLQAGGKDFQLIPCLNDDDAWIQAMAGMVAGRARGPLPDVGFLHG